MVVAKRLHVDPAAYDEVDHASETLDESRGLGYELLDAFDAATRSIREAPEAYAPFCRTEFGVVRSKLIRRFRYRVIFVDLPDLVWIVAFAHQSQRPFYWRSRSKVHRPRSRSSCCAHGRP